MLGKLPMKFDNTAYTIQPDGNTPRQFTGSCIFPNENGTCQITLSNLQFDDEDVFYAIDSDRFGVIYAQVNVSLIVKCKDVSINYFFHLN